MNNNHIKQLVLLIAILIIALASFASYAFFTANVAGNTTASDTVIQTGTMQLLLTDGEQVSLENALPGTSVTKTFRVKNTGTVQTNYDVYLSEIINEFEDKNDLVYVLSSTNGCANNIETVVPSVVGEQSKIVSSCSINSNVEHEYTLTITFKEDGTIQDDNKNKKISAKISINEYKEPMMSVYEKILYLKNNHATDLEYDGTGTLGENGTPDNNLRYVGATPSNYIYYNCSTTNPSEMNDSTCEKWRIIGVMNNIEDENGNSTSRVKIMRNESIGSYSWDSSGLGFNSGWGVNQWGESTTNSNNTYIGADLMRELNTDYLGDITVGTNGKWYSDNNSGKYMPMPTKTLNYNAQNMIQTVKWNTGATNIMDIMLKNVYENERSENTGKICENGNSCTDTVIRTTTWTGKVALIYPSDFGYATTGGTTVNKETCLNTIMESWKESEMEDCSNNSWIYILNRGQWTITPCSYTSNANLIVTIENGTIWNNSAYNFRKTIPALYLKSDIYIVDGNGSETNPYKLTM